MKTRHRIPSIFNLSMVDVLCCALGCVILLWLLFFREAKERTEAAGHLGDTLSETTKELKAARLDLASLRDKADKDQEAAREALAHLSKQADKDREALRLEIASLRESSDANEKKLQITAADLKKALLAKDKLQQVVLVGQKDYEAAKVALNRLQAVIDKHREELRDFQARELTMSADAEKRAKQSASLATQMSAALKTIDLLEKQLVDKRDLEIASLKKLNEVLARLQTSEGMVKKLEKDATVLQQARNDQGAKMTAAEVRAASLENELNRGKQALLLADRKQDELLQSVKRLESLLALRDTELVKSNVKLQGLESEKNILAGQVRAAENRFAGIELKGERVMFLVDWSGSMGKKDVDTPDPAKWPTVCETLGKLMSSLPEMKKFQVILFSDEYSYPLSNDRRWIDFKGAESVKSTVEALKRKPPQGGTNMADAFREVFLNYRGQGLDTVYVFSDGLPNAGPGLPNNSDSLKESERTALCSTWLKQALKTWNGPLADRPRVRINTIGFYFDSPEVGAFLWVLAREHDGSFVGMSRP